MRRTLLALVVLLFAAVSGTSAAAAPRPSVPRCALGTSAADLKGFFAVGARPGGARYVAKGAAAHVRRRRGRLRVRPGARSRSIETTQRFPENQLVSIAALTDPTVRTVVLPNHDTTYTVGRVPALGAARACSTCPTPPGATT